MGVWIHKFTVSGALAFPLDMLRYEGVFFINEEDALLAEQTLHDENDGPVSIHLMRHSSRVCWNPRWERWKSFGWKIEAHEEIGVAVENLDDELKSMKFFIVEQGTQVLLIGISQGAPLRALSDRIFEEFPEGETIVRAVTETKITWPS